MFSIIYNIEIYMYHIIKVYKSLINVYENSENYKHNNKN